MTSLIQSFCDLLSQRTDITPGELYFILASVVMYLRSPLKDEQWNQFRVLLEKNAISMDDACFMTDEEKNPHVWSLLNKKTRTEFQNYLSECLLATRKYLLKKYPHLPHKHTQVSSVVCIPDMTNPDIPPTFFPSQYIKAQLKHKSYVNELTGQPFSWTIVDKINNNQPTCTITQPKTVKTDVFLKLMTRELASLQKKSTHCTACKRKSVNVKSIKDYQTVYFCSLKCMNAWEFEDD
jgi:hypothetical protein